MEYTEAGRSRSSLGLATASIVLAVLSSLIIYLAVPFGALAIITGLLSRGNRQMFTRARVAVIVAACAIIGSSTATGYALYRVNNDPEIKAQVEELVDYYLEQYGILMPEDAAAPQTIQPDTQAPAPAYQEPAPAESSPWWSAPWNNAPSQSQPEQNVPEGGYSA